MNTDVLPEVNRTGSLPNTVVIPPPEQSGERIGRCRLLQEIGEGGFGTVWMAEQVEPVTRRVALKIIKLGMDTRAVIARFEAERQALALMDHPNKGVIHRDIKPSNVLVTRYADKPVVKVIDFGIAKATQSKLTDKTLFTRFEQFIGTPVYMSPEQAAVSAVDIDTRSDIYALGVLLYELMTGKPPFDAKTLASAGCEEMRRIIREVEPPKPSSRLSSVAGEERNALPSKKRCPGAAALASAEGGLPLPPLTDLLRTLLLARLEQADAALRARPAKNAGP